MKIKLIHTQKTETEIDVQLPYYCKTIKPNEEKYYEVYEVDGQTTWDRVSLYHGTQDQSSNGYTIGYTITEDWGEMIPSTEQEYIEAFNKLKNDIEYRYEQLTQ